MYVIDNLTQSDWAKILPGLRQSLQVAQTLDPNTSIAKLDWEDKINSDIRVQTINKKWFWIRPHSYPSDWTKVEWIDFVVSLAKNPNVVQLGTLTEIPFTEIPISPWLGAKWSMKEVYSPSALLYDIDTEGTAPPGGTSGSGSTNMPTGGTSSNFPMIALLVGGGLILYTIMRRR